MKKHHLLSIYTFKFVYSSDYLLSKKQFLLFYGRRNPEASSSHKHYVAERGHRPRREWHAKRAGVSPSCILNKRVNQLEQTTESNQLIEAVPLSYFTPMLIKTVITQLSGWIIGGLCFCTRTMDFLDVLYHNKTYYQYKKSVVLESVSSLNKNIYEIQETTRVSA